MEGPASRGLYLDQAHNNLIRGGTLENLRSGTGLVISDSASGNAIDGVFLEDNRVNIDCRGPRNQFLLVYAGGSASRFGAGADCCHLIGGNFSHVVIDEGVRDLKLLGVSAGQITEDVILTHGSPEDVTLDGLVITNGLPQ